MKTGETNYLCDLYSEPNPRLSVLALGTAGILYRHSPQFRRCLSSSFVAQFCKRLLIWTEMSKQGRELQVNLKAVPNWNWIRYPCIDLVNTTKLTRLAQPRRLFAFDAFKHYMRIMLTTRLRSFCDLREFDGNFIPRGKIQLHSFDQLQKVCRVIRRNFIMKSGKASRFTSISTLL